MHPLREIWSLLYGLLTVGAAGENPVALGVLLVAGAVVLFAGRRLFWLMAGLAGYYLGSLLAPLLFGPSPVPGGLSLGFAVIIGLLAAGTQQVTARVITAGASAPLAYYVAEAFGLPGWAVVMIVAGTIAVALLLLQMNYNRMLIVLSVIYGAVALFGSLLFLFPAWSWVANPFFFLLLLAAGTAVQGYSLFRERSSVLVIPREAGGRAPVEPYATDAREAWLQHTLQFVPPEVVGRSSAHSAPAAAPAAPAPATSSD